MVQIKKDEVNKVVQMKGRIDSMFERFGFTVDKGVCGSWLYNSCNKEVGRYLYFITCDIHGPSAMFMPIAETIEKELGIEVIIYE